MLFDQSGSREHVGDQAEGLRQLRRPDTVASEAPASGSTRVLKWPRVVLISEMPSTDMGARFAFHLACMLGQREGGACGPSLLLDLAPAASRLPQVLADRLPADRYPSVWTELAAGRALATLKIGGETPLAVAAEHQLVPGVLDQLPRLYEQLVRQLSRGGDRWGWIVMLGLEHIVPLDRACWQAADDIVLVSEAGAGACQRQTTALRTRISELDPKRSLWTLPKRRLSWFGRRTPASSSAGWLETGLAPQVLPPVFWPHHASDRQLALGSRADQMLRRSALRVADQLRTAASTQTSPMPTRRAS